MNSLIQEINTISARIAKSICIKKEEEDGICKINNTDIAYKLYTTNCSK